MKPSLLFFFIICSGFLSAQTVDSIPEEKRVYEFLEQMPEFPGGIKELYSYINNNTIYPAPARDSCITGTIFLKFIVNSDGSVSDVTVLRGLGHGLDEEAVRVISQMPTWEPGKQNGKPADVWYKIPIKFVSDCLEEKNK